MFPVGVYNVEDYPLNWIDGTYYSTYKGNTFQVSSIENVKSEAEYDAVITIDLNNQGLTTDFTDTLLSKFKNLQSLVLNDNSNISILNTSSLLKLQDVAIRGSLITELIINSNDLLILNAQDNELNSVLVFSLANVTEIRLDRNNLTSFDLTGANNVTFLEIYANLLVSFDASDLTSCTHLRCQNNQLDNLVNSQILIDLDSHGLSNGYLQSIIFGGGSLTAAGQTAKSNLLSKGWTIVGI